MFRVCKMSGNVYAIDLGDDLQDYHDPEELLEAIQNLAGQGNPVLFVDDLEEAAEIFGVAESEIQMAK